MVELADILLEVNPGERDPLVFPHHITGRAGQFDFNGTAAADRGVELGDLIVFGGVRIKVVFPIPFADRRDLTTEQESGFDDSVQGGSVHHRKSTGQGQDDRIGEGVGFVAVTRGDAREDLGAGADLDVDL